MNVTADRRAISPYIKGMNFADVDKPYEELVNYVALAPGIQEEFILERIRDQQYEMVVWDTAPAGDTLRLLDLPGRFLQHLRAAPRFT